MKVAKVVKALESSHPGPSRVQAPGALIATLVPVGAFGLAYLSSRSRRSVEAWVTASVVGTTAVICGSILAIKAVERRP